MELQMADLSIPTVRDYLRTTGNGSLGDGLELLVFLACLITKAKADRLDMNVQETFRQRQKAYNAM